MIRRSCWTDEMVEALREYLATGVTSGQAAQYISRKFGRHFSGHAIIGKAWRMGFPLLSRRHEPQRSRRVTSSPVNATWPIERINRLIDLRNSGKSFEDIAQELGVHISCVTTKAHRLKARGYNIETNQRHRLPPVVRLHRPPKPRSGSPRAPVIVLELLPHADEPVPTGLEGGCQWIVGPAPERLFCGAATIPGSSWCPHHHARCFNPPRQGVIHNAKRAHGIR